MTRKKVKLVWIVSDSARKASFKKRRVGLLKKVNELTTLCGVSAFVIVYGPDDDEPAVWPSRAAVQQLFARFRGVPEMERCKKMMNQESYLRERTTKVQDQLRKTQRKNKEMEMGHVMHQMDQGRGMDELDVSEMSGLVWMLEERMKESRKRLEYFQQGPLPSGNNSFTPQNIAAMEEMGRSAAEGIRTPTDSVMWDQWFIDMMNQNESAAGAGASSSVRSDMGLPPHAYNPNDIGLPYVNFGGSRAGGIDMGLSHGNYRGSSTAGGSDMGLPYGNFGLGSTGLSDIGLPHGNFGGTSHDMGLGLPYNYGNLRGSVGGSDMGLGLLPQGNTFGGSSTGGASDLGLPYGLFGGSSAASDAGLPYDVTKPWQSFFSP